MQLGLGWLPKELLGWAGDSCWATTTTTTIMTTRIPKTKNREKL
jgi:hypothetical protein